MLKRSRPEEAKNGERPGKRFRPNKPCLINSLSDELFLRIFSLLSTQDLARCQRVSHRFNRIAGDSQVWKLAFYTRFVQPRLSRIQSSLRRSGEELGVSNIKWMDNEKKAGSQEKHWKRLYKLQHNWMRGSCDVREVGISDCGVQTPEINLQVTMQNGMIFTAGCQSGLRAWRDSQDENLVAHIPLHNVGNSSYSGRPTCIAVNHGFENEQSPTVHVAVGFDCGRYAIFELNLPLRRFALRATSSQNEDNSRVTAIAISLPYIATADVKKKFSVYKLAGKVGPDGLGSKMTLVTSLKSDTVDHPLSLSFRSAGEHGIFASIAYALPSFPVGWSLGIQEMRILPDGTVRSRTATSTPSAFTLQPGCVMTVRKNTPTLPLDGEIITKPTSISYVHPYLLVTHGDNTLTVFMVRSTDSILEIGTGQRLWGHTSAVAGAKIGSRGKAVSVARQGNEIRIWELEGSRRLSKRAPQSVRVQPERIPGENDVGWQEDVMSGLVGFDTEKVILLAEKRTSEKSLLVYDFS